MAYVALYRKYRPKCFKDVLGQEIVTTILKNCIKNRKIGHAYIFSGTRGTGKTSVAKIFSRAVNCLSPCDDGDLCQKCDACINTDGNNIDIIEIDAASNNGVDEIREIRNNVTIMPTYVKYKIYIIDEVHMLSGSAFNALLKTLEEPPEHVIFILATTELNKIPATVLSRCQKLDFKKIPPSLIEKQLKKILDNENIIIDKQVVELIASLSDGSFRDAINLMDQVISYGKENICNDDVYDLIGMIPIKSLCEILNAIVECDIKGGMTLINKYYEQGKNFYKISNRLQQLVRDIIVYNNTHDYFDKEYSNQLDKYALIDNNKLLLLSQVLFELNNSIKKSTEQKLLFETYYIKLSMIFAKNSNLLDDDGYKVETNSYQNNRNSDFNSASTEEDNIKIMDNHVSSTWDLSYKPQRIINTLAGASKQLKNDFIDKYSTINDYIIKSEYNSIVTLLNKAVPQVVSSKNLLFVFSSQFDVVLFDKNIENIQKLLKTIYGVKYDLVSVDLDEWKRIEKKYKEDRDNGIIYKYEKEIVVSKKNKKISALEKEAENIFGDGLISEE